MPTATKNHSKWDAAVDDVRAAVAEMPEPHRTAASEDIETLIGNPGLMMSEKDLESDTARDELFAEMPLSLDELADGECGTPMAWTEVGKEIRTLALEVRMLKRQVHLLEGILRSVGAQFVVGLPASESVQS
jgi:hypothetical protein